MEFPTGMKNLDFDKLSEISKRTQQISNMGFKSEMEFLERLIQDKDNMTYVP